MQLLSAIASIRSDMLNSVFSVITKLGEELIAILILCAIFWCIDKKLAYGIGISYFLSGLLVQGLKITFRIDRPWVQDKSFKPVDSAIETATGYSFPSGHTQSSSALFGTLGFSLKKNYQRILCFLVVLLVGFSRMYLGVHTLLDVGVSMVISLIMSYIMVNYYGKKENQKQIVVPLILCLIAVTTAVYALVLFSLNTISNDYVIDCLKAAGAGIGFASGMYIEKRFIVFSTKCRNIFQQIIKYILGIVGVLAVKEGLKLIIGTGPVVDTCRYILIGLFITAIYPYVIKKVFELKDNQ